MKQMFKNIFFISLLFLFGCGIATPLSYNKDKLVYLDIRMEKQKVIDLIGTPDEVRGSVKNVDGDIVTVWQYDLYNKSSAWYNLGLGVFPFFTITWWVPTLGNYNRPDSYWIYFVNENLAQWGRAGDWQPDVIMNIRLEND